MMLHLGFARAKSVEKARIALKRDLKKVVAGEREDVRVMCKASATRGTVGRCSAVKQQ
jgi:hypothetical protein